MMVIDNGNQATNRPYSPASNVIAILQRLRSRNLPDRIDADFLIDAGIAESLVQRVVFGLRSLKLIENDSPTPALRAISTSTDEEYQEILTGLIRDAYSDVFAVVDPAVDDQDRILNVFRRYSPASQRGRMVSFFLGMCREAGIPTLDAPRQRSMTDAGRVTRRQTGRTTSIKPKSPAQTRQSTQERPDFGVIVGPDTMGGIPPHLALLIQALPPAGKPMSAAKRAQWLAMAEAVLTFTYPETDEGVESYDEEGDAMQS
jgi:hypothetical protein